MVTYSFSFLLQEIKVATTKRRIIFFIFDQIELESTKLIENLWIIFEKRKEMKKLKNLLFLLLFGLLCSCQNQKEQQDILKEDLVEKDSIATAEKLAHCYLFENGKDTIKLTYQQEGNDIEGWMNYDFYEKDGSIGKIEGE